MSSMHCCDFYSLHHYHVRAKYYPELDGSLRLAQVQAFSRPVFSDQPYDKNPDRRIASPSLQNALGELPTTEGSSEEYRRRAFRRAQVNAFDLLMCNPRLNAFVTLTFARDKVEHIDYEYAYERLKIWLSNRVQRQGLKYLIVPEYHKSGDIHLHGLFNSSALNYLPSIREDGSRRERNGKAIYNFVDWHEGFSTMQKVGRSSLDTVKVSKYIFKYMTKNSGQKIGGRYFLHGGDLVKPTYVFADSLTAIDTAGLTCTFDRTISVEGGEYTEFNYL